MNALVKLPDRRRSYRLVAEDGVASAGEMQASMDAAIAAKETLPTSTVQAVDWLITFRPAAELRQFLEGRPPRELDLITKHIRRRHDTRRS